MNPISNLIKLNRHVSFQVKIMGIVVCLILILAFWINWEVRAKTSSLLEKQLIQHAKVISSNVAYMITEPVLTSNIYQLNSIMEKMLKEDPSVRYFFIIDKDGGLLLSSFPEGLPVGLAEKNSPAEAGMHLKELTTEEGIIWDVATPIAKGFGGTLRIGVSEKHRATGLQEVSQKIMLSTSIVIILTLVAAYLATKMLTHPIEQLVKFAKTIGQGNYNTKLVIDWWTSSEIAALLETFNETATNLRISAAKIDAIQKARKKLLQKIITAQEEERARVARELHDETNQCLAAISLGLDRICEENELNKCRQSSFELKEIILQASAALKRLAWELRPSTIDKVGLILAIEIYIQNFINNYKINVSYLCELSESEIPGGETSIVVYRIIQEALTNIAKHAMADHVEIVLKKVAERFMVIIEDNGKGFEPEKLLNFAGKSAGKFNSLGLYGMMERAELIGGKLVIESEPDQGTTICLTVPLDGVMKNDDKNPLSNC